MAQVNATEPKKPGAAVRVTVAVPAPPAGKTTGLGETFIVKGPEVTWATSVLAEREPSSKKASLLRREGNSSPLLLGMRVMLQGARTDLHARGSDPAAT